MRRGPVIAVTWHHTLRLALGMARHHPVIRLAPGIPAPGQRGRSWSSAPLGVPRRQMLVTTTVTHTADEVRAVAGHLRERWSTTTDAEEWHDGL